MGRIKATGVLALTAVLPTGYGGPPQETDAATPAALRAQILQLAGAARADCEDQDNDPGVRAALDPPVRERISLVPARPEAEVGEAAGAWQQVWSDPTPAFGGCISARNTC